MGPSCDEISAGDKDVPPSVSQISQPTRRSSLSSPIDLSPSPVSLRHLSESRSPYAFSPLPGQSVSTCELDDTMSVASSASALNSPKFSLPKFWPPSIQACIDLSSDEERSRAMGPLIRNEVVRVLATQMFCYTMKPNKVFCTEVSKMLVKKYPFMRDKGEKVSGYVSIIHMKQVQYSSQCADCLPLIISPLCTHLNPTLQASWEKKLIEKVHNLRSCSKNKRPLSETDTDSSPKAKRGRPKVSQVLSRYPPLQDTGDDEVTLMRNNNLIEKELDKERPRKEILLSLVRQTYSARRQKILTESEEATATALLNEFPVLKKIYVVCTI